MACIRLNKSYLESDPDFFTSFDFVLTDCDGVLWIANDVIPGIPETLQAFRKLGKTICFVTNNSTKSVEEYLKKFKTLNIEAHKSEIFATSNCAALYLKSQNYEKTVYVIGTPGVIEELDKVNIKYLPIGPDPMNILSMEALKKCEHEILDPSVEAVLVGFDEHLSFPKILKAASYLNDPKCLFIATNTDERFPGGTSRIVIPGTGVMVAAVETASGRTPIIMGKPHSFMFDCIKQIYPELNPKRCLMIGDRLNTDILFGSNIGARTLLTLTGVTLMEEVDQIRKDAFEESAKLLPDFIINSLADLIPLFKG